MSQTNSSSRLAPWQAMTMLAVGIAIIFFGLMALKVNARIVLAVDGAIMCLMACAFGISYDSVQKGIKDTIASMLVAMLILFPSVFSSAPGWPPERFRLWSITVCRSLLRHSSFRLPASCVH